MQKILIIPVSALLVLLSITAFVASGDRPLLAATISTTPVEPPNPPLFVYTGTTPPPGVYQAPLDRMWILVPRLVDQNNVIEVVKPEQFNMPVFKPKTELEAKAK